MKRFVLALQLLTRLPLPPVQASEQDFAAAIRWFPAAGMVVGAVVMAAAWAGSQVDPWLGALLGTIAWAAITGALHLDGLGDIADATGAAHQDHTKVSAVLADPHIGGFGVVAIVLQIATKLVLLKLLLDAAPLWSLLAVCLLARTGALVWTLTLPPLHEGLGSRFRTGIRKVHLLPWLLAWLAAAIFAPALVVAPLLFGLWHWWLKHRIGGISGDGHGAGIELVESGLLLALVIAS